jgi:hypothetical protein
MDKAEFFIGPYPVGPTCARNKGLTASSEKSTKSIAVRNDQLDLFGGENDEKTSSNERSS